MDIGLGEIMALGAGTFYAGGTLFARAGSDHATHRAGLLVSLYANALLLVLISGIYVVVDEAVTVSLTGVALFGAAGIAGTLVGRWASIESIHRLGPSRATVYVSAQPVLTTAIAVTTLGEVLSAADLLGGMVVVVGVTLTSWDRSDGIGAGSHWGIQRGQRLAGIGFGLAAAAAYSLANVLRKAGVSVWPEPILGAATGVLVALVLTSTSRQRLSSLAAKPAGWRDAGNLPFALFGVCNGIAQLLLFFSLQSVPVWKVNVLATVEPVLTVVLSALLFRRREQLRVVTVMSAAVVVIGCVLLVSA